MTQDDYKDKLTAESFLEWMGYGPELPQEYLDHMEKEEKESRESQIKEESKPDFEEPVF